MQIYIFILSFRCLDVRSLKVISIVGHINAQTNTHTHMHTHKHTCTHIHIITYRYCFFVVNLAKIINIILELPHIHV